LTRYEEYRGVDYDDDDISERLDPADKDLFVQGDDGFGAGGFPSFDYGSAFANAGIDVHEFVGDVSTDDRGIDVVVVEATDDKDDSWEDDGHIWNNSVAETNPEMWLTMEIRDWTYDTLATSSMRGTEEQYADCYVFTMAVDYYTLTDKPYIDGKTLDPNDEWEGDENGRLDPLADVEDRNDNGSLEQIHELGFDYDEGDGDASFPYDDNDLELDGDHLAVAGPPWEWNHDLSPVDMDKDGDVEKPVAESVSEIINEYTRAELVKHLVTHEIGHAIGCSSDAFYADDYHCDNPSCIMCQIAHAEDWDRIDTLCSDCRSAIYIHND
jgi:hypothetical protein